MANNVEKIRLMTIYRMSTMSLKISTKFDGNDITNMSGQNKTFEEINKALSPLNMITIHEVNKIIDVLDQIEAVEYVEIVNPSNGNGFEITFNRVK